MRASATEPPAEHHRHEHRSLLVRMPKGARRPVDAVVVAAARPAAHLATSADVAASLGAVLVALCSRRTRLSEVAELAAKRPTLEWAAIEVPPATTIPY